MISCVRQDNENSGNLISVVQFLIILDMGNVTVRQTNFRVRLSSWIFELGFRVGISSWIFELRFRVGFCEMLQY